jgi:hypothetical protein
MVRVFAVRSGDVRMRQARAELDIIITADDMFKMVALPGYTARRSSRACLDRQDSTWQSCTPTMQVCKAVIQASVASMLHSPQDAYSDNSISLDGFGDMTVFVAPVDLDGVLKDMHAPHAACLRDIHRFTHSSNPTRSWWRWTSHTFARWRQVSCQGTVL